MEYNIKNNETWIFEEQWNTCFASLSKVRSFLYFSTLYERLTLSEMMYALEYTIVDFCRTY